MTWGIKRQVDCPEPESALRSSGKVESGPRNFRLSLSFSLLTIMSTSQIVVPHPWSLQYIGLRGAAAVLRGLAGLVQSRAILAQRAAIPAGVTIRRIAVPSRDAGRSIDVDVYERAPGTGREDAGPRAVHVNFHGCVSLAVCFH